MADYPIVTGSIQNPPKQYSYTIPVSGTETVFADLNFVRVLTANHSNFQIRFGMTGAVTDVVGAGVGYELPEVVRNIQITNTDPAVALVIVVAVAVGKIYDDRLNVSGNINVVNAAGTCLSVTNCEGDAPLIVTAQDIADLNVGQVSVDNTADLILAANAARESVTIQAGTTDLFIGKANTVTTANGFKIVANSTHTLTWAGDIYGIRAAAGGVTAYYSEQEK